MSGFIAISRRLFAHDLWVERREFSRFEAWLDLLQTANWQPGRQFVKGKPIEVSRGQLLASNRYLMERWGWKSLTKVQSYLRMLSDFDMIRSEDVAVTSRITICKYESYNSLEVTDKSDKGQTKVRQRSDKGQTKVTNEVKVEQVKQEEKEKQEEQPPTAAGGFNFEKLQKQVGPICAKLIIEGGLSEKLSTDKKRLLVKWANHKYTRGQEIITTAVLMEILKKFQDTDTAVLMESISESIGGDYARLVITKGKASAAALPNYYSAELMAKLSSDSEATQAYIKHLKSLGWEYKYGPAGSLWIKPK